MMGLRLAQDVQTSLTARGFPVRVEYGVRRHALEGHHQLITIARDRSRADTLGAAPAGRANPRSLMARGLPCVATVHARSTAAGATEAEHEEAADRLADAFLVALYEWGSAGRAGPVPVSEVRLLSPEERGGTGPHLPGEAIEIRFSIPRAVLVLDYADAAEPEAALEAASTAVLISAQGSTEEEVP
ncbi:MAG: hypothetical protein A2Y78_00220 [Acidobacteria bacterium RBG_13_68_16]|nr:MAG: hypothetical protein A2Y78_00220 [Acidobacteria bacterium RBG_13_68_16]